MSAHGRKRSNGRAQLMLLRGGLDDVYGSARGCAAGFGGNARGGASAAAMADEADWQSFCSRIGWQDSADEVGEDYADRLAEKIFGGAQLRDDVIELAVEREVKAAKEVPVTESALRRATARGALLAVAGMAAAAVVCFFGASVLSAAGGTARAVPVDEAAPPAVAPSPVAQPLDSADAQSTATPVDSASPKTKPPGSLVAQRMARHRARGRAVAQQVAAGQDHHAEVVQTALSAPVPLSEMIDIRPGALHDFDSTAVPDIASLTPRTVAADLRSDNHVNARNSEPAVAWSAPVSRSRDRAESPSWGLTPASERWYGMGLAPTYEPSNLPTGMTVMAQVDVGKALKL